MSYGADAKGFLGTFGTLSILSITDLMDVMNTTDDVKYLGVKATGWGGESAGFDDKLVLRYWNTEFSLNSVDPELDGSVRGEVDWNSLNITAGIDITGNPVRDPSTGLDGTRPPPFRARPRSTSIMEWLSSTPVAPTFLAALRSIWGRSRPKPASPTGQG